MNTSLEQALANIGLRDAGALPGMPVVLTGQHEMRDQLLLLTRNAERQLAIWSLGLDTGLFETTAFLDALKRFVLARRHTRVRVLMPHMPSSEHRHGLLAMAERLPASFEIRTIDNAPLDAGELFLSDDRGVLYRIHMDRWDGMSNHNDVLVTRFYLAQFEASWSMATPIERVTEV